MAEAFDGEEFLACGVHGNHWSALSGYLHRLLYLILAFVLASVEYVRGFVSGILYLHEFDAIDDLVRMDRSIATTALF